MSFALFISFIRSLLYPRAIHYGNIIILGVATEAVRQAQRLLVRRAVRCVSLYFHFCSANVPQGERIIRVFPARVPTRRLQHSPPPRCARACRLDRGGGPPPQPSRILAGKSG